MLKDLRIIIRTPVFFLNNFSTIILLPVIVLVTFAVPSLKNDPDIVFLMSGFSNGSLSFSASYENIAMAAFFAVGAVNASFSGVASSALSREGSNAYYMKFIPVKYENQLFTKAGLGCIIGVTSSFILILIISLIFKADPLFAFAGLIISVFAAVVVSLTGILLDANFPLLNWDNEQKAVKQNMNVIINMVIAAAISAGGVLLAVKIISNVYAVMGILIVLSLLITLALAAAIIKYSDRIKSRVS
jgi:ABC-2 type transport system permease protein